MMLDNETEKRLQEIKATGVRKHVGGHESISNGVSNPLIQNIKHGGKAFGLFLRPKLGFKKIASLGPDQLEIYKDVQGILGDINSWGLPHAPFSVNLATNRTDLQVAAIDLLNNDLLRCHELGIKYYNIHPGSTCGVISRETGILNIASCINKIISLTPDIDTVIVLETMAGNGNLLGGPFEDLRDIIASVKNKSRVGVCIDTCHVYAAGYDITTFESFNKVMNRFDEIIGLKYLCGIHLNDSKFPLASFKDRHETIGNGCIGIDCFKFIMNDSRFENIPMILETPINDENPSYEHEIQLLYSLVSDDVTNQITEIKKDKSTLDRVIISHSSSLKTKKSRSISSSSKSKPKSGSLASSPPEHQPQVDNIRSSDHHPTPVDNLKSYGVDLNDIKSYSAPDINTLPSSRFSFNMN